MISELYLTIAVELLLLLLAIFLMHKLGNKLDDALYREKVFIAFQVKTLFIVICGFLVAIGIPVLMIKIINISLERSFSIATLTFLPVMLLAIGVLSGSYSESIRKKSS